MLTKSLYFLLALGIVTLPGYAHADNQPCLLPNPRSATPPTAFQDLMLLAVGTQDAPTFACALRRDGFFFLKDGTITGTHISDGIFVFVDQTGTATNTTLEIVSYGGIGRSVTYTTANIAVYQQWYVDALPGTFCGFSMQASTPTGDSWFPTPQCGQDPIQGASMGPAFNTSADTLTTTLQVPVMWQLSFYVSTNGAPFTERMKTRPPARDVHPQAK